MKKFLWFTAVVAVLTLAVGAALALGIHWSGALAGTTVTIDGEPFDGALVAVLAGSAAAVGVVIAGVVVITVLASVAIAIPVVLVAAALAVVGALFVGLSPLLIPVLLVVGAYVLLSRRARRAAARPAVFPSPDSPAAS